MFKFNRRFREICNKYYSAWNRAIIIPVEEVEKDEILKYLKYGKILWSETVRSSDEWEVYYEVLWMKCNLIQAIKMNRHFVKKEKGVYYGTFKKGA